MEGQLAPKSSILIGLTYFSYPLLAPKKIHNPCFHLKFFIPNFFIEFFHTPYFHLNFNIPYFRLNFHTPYFHLNIHIPLFFTERLVFKTAQRKKTLDLLYAKAVKPACWGHLNFFPTFECIKSEQTCPWRIAEPARSQIQVNEKNSHLLLENFIPLILSGTEKFAPLIVSHPLFFSEGKTLKTLQPGILT